MASNKFPGPNYTRLIDSDPQIVKVPMDTVQWGARRSILPSGSDSASETSTGQAPNAPEMTVKHVKG